MSLALTHTPRDASIPTFISLLSAKVRRVQHAIQHAVAGYFLLRHHGRRSILNGKILSRRRGKTQQRGKIEEYRETKQREKIMQRGKTEQYRERPSDVKR